MGATSGIGESARAGGAQAARERAPHRRDEAQRAALLEQAEEEKKTAQQARLASIREQQASLVAQPLVRWLLTVPAEARVERTEASTGAEEAASAEATTGAEKAASAEAATGAEEAASAEAAMDKPAKPPDRLDEQSAVSSAASVQDPGEPAELKEPGGPA